MRKVVRGRTISGMLTSKPKRSSFCRAGECVAVSKNGNVTIHDMKDPNGSTLTVHPESWGTFLTTLKDAGLLR